MNRIIITSLILVSLFAGCKKDKGDPPVLPPASSMTIDFSNFIITAKSSEVPELKGENNSAWEFAAFTAGFWRLIIGTTLYIPVTSFQVTIDQNPVYVSEKTWEWKYSTTIGNVDYETRLNGHIGSSNVEWKMYISKESGTDSYTDFLWFEGTSAFDGKSGHWTLNQSHDINVPLLEIDWEQPGTSIPHVTYTYVKNDAHQGSYIEYGPLTSSAYNAYYDVHYYNDLAEKFYDVSVEWNTNTKNGRVKSLDYLGDTWYCWDSSRINVTCE